MVRADLGFVHPGAHEQGEQGREAAQEEQRPPAPVREHEEVAQRGEQIAGGVALL